MGGGQIWRLEGGVVAGRMRADGGGPRWKSGEKWLRGKGRQVEEEGGTILEFMFFFLIIIT